jgi:hypothetical protein
VLIALTLITCFYFLYPNKINKNPQSSVVPPIKKEELKSEIVNSKILSPFTHYSDLSPENKKVEDYFLEKNKDVPVIKYLIDNYNGGKDSVGLIYSDENTIVISVSNEKRGGFLYLFDIKTSKELGNYQNYTVDQNSIVKGDYLIFPCENTLKQESFCYYRAGDLKVNFITNSNLENTKETYISGLWDDGVGYSSAFNEKTKKLLITLFKNQNKSDTPNTKLREVEFVLP